MCLIIDASKFGEYLDPDNDDMKPVRQWMHRTGKIAFSPAVKLEGEVYKSRRFTELLRTYTQRGKVKRFDAIQVSKREQGLEGLRSDDPHVIALALVSNVKLLVSGDKDLHEDFKRIVGGSIYQNKKHKHLLRNDLCP